MNNYFFKSMGLENIDIGIVLTVLMALIIIMFVLNVISLSFISKMKKKYNKFMLGKNAASLEEEITALFEDNKFLKTSIEKNRKDIHALYRKFESSLQKVGIIKYDAFDQIGGKLSFCMALLDENNNGFILNSVYGAEGCYTYTKKIENGFCQTSLGQEEEKALNMAMHGEK